MPEGAQFAPGHVFLAGALVILLMATKRFLVRRAVPPALGFLALGLILRVVQDQWHVVTPDGEVLLGVMAEIGVAALLFHAGLGSDLPGLARELRLAIPAWIGNVVVAGAFGFLTAYWIVGLEFVPSLMISVALTATSVGVPTAVWDDAKALKSRLGNLFLDISALDDISAVLLLAMAMAIARFIGPEATGSFADIAGAAGLVLLKAVALGAACVAFSLYGERAVTAWFLKTRRRAPDPMLAWVGIGLLIAALAGWLGFSMAMGALFAGLAFSRDPLAVRMDGSFQPLLALFSPFFLVHVGYQMQGGVLWPSLGIGLALAVAAIAGKVLGTAWPLAGRISPRAGWLMGVSMVPRAEIALLITSTAATLGPWAMPPEAYGAMVVVAVVTSVGAPIVLAPLLRDAGPLLDATPAE